MTIHDALGSIGCIGDEEFVEREEKYAGEEAGDEVRERQTPETDARGADGGDLGVTGVVCQGIEQREKQSNREDKDKPGWKADKVIFEDVETVKFLVLELAEFGVEISNREEENETAQAVRERHKEFTQQITVQKTHSGDNVAKSWKTEMLKCGAGGTRPRRSCLSPLPLDTRRYCLRAR